jgi:YHS domain-containing protein
MKRRSFVVPVLAGLLSSACCPGGNCIKDPPCRPCENPLSLSPIQKKALEAGSHARVGAPVVYTFDEKTYYLFTETGLNDFEKDPASFDEKGALRIIRGGKTRRADINPGDAFDWAAAEAGARPFTPPAK